MRSFRRWIAARYRRLRGVGTLSGMGNGRRNRTAISLIMTSSAGDRKSTRLNSSHSQISYAVFCLKKKKKNDYSSELAEPNDPLKLKPAIHAGHWRNETSRFCTRGPAI